MKKRISSGSSKTGKKVMNLSAKRHSVGSHKEKSEILPEKLTKHKRSKTTSLSIVSSAAGTSAKPASHKESLVGRKKIMTGLKLSPALFKKTVKPSLDAIQKSETKSSDSVQLVARVKQPPLVCNDFNKLV